MYININIEIENLLETNAQLFRVMVLCDRRPNGVAYTQADLFQNSTLGGHFTSLINVNELDRFKIYQDKYYAMSSNKNEREVLMIKVRIPVSGLKTQYNTLNAGNITDI